MRKQITLITILLCCLYAGTVRAVFQNGSSLIGYIEEGVGSNNYMYALGYIASTYDASAISAKKLFCPPKGVTLEQIVHIVHNFMEKHPEFWNYSASQNVEEALKEVYPCK